MKVASPPGYVVDDQSVSRSVANGHATTGSNGHAAASNGRSNGHAAPNGNGNSRPRSNGRKATASQVRAIHAIANRQGLDLALTLQERYGCDHAEDLEASELIDELKNASAGGRR